MRDSFPSSSYDGGSRRENNRYLSIAILGERYRLPRKILSPIEICYSIWNLNARDVNLQSVLHHAFFLTVREIFGEYLVLTEK